MRVDLLKCRRIQEANGFVMIAKRIGIKKGESNQQRKGWKYLTLNGHSPINKRKI